MPLRSGKSKKVISENIKELEEHGTRPRKKAQIIAIALDVARKSGAKIPKSKAKKK